LRAVIAYRFETDTLLSIGDPVGPPEELPALLREFAVYCAQHDWQFAFFQARPERLPLYRDQGWRALHIGEQPLLPCDRFRVEGCMTWVAIWARHGWMVDLMRRREDSAPGTMELLVVRSLAAARERGDALLSLALSALAKVDAPGEPGPPAAPPPDARVGNGH